MKVEGGLITPLPKEWKLERAEKMLTEVQHDF
jgi:hypothetical protein